MLYIRMYVGVLEEWKTTTLQFVGLEFNLPRMCFHIKYIEGIYMMSYVYGFCYLDSNR